MLKLTTRIIICPGKKQSSRSEMGANAVMWKQGDPIETIRLPDGEKLFETPRLEKVEKVQVERRQPNMPG